MKNVIALTYPHVTQRTLFLRTGDWSWGQVPWVTSTQPKISIEIGCCASIAKKANTLYQLSKDTSTITPMSALCYWHIHTRLFSPTSRSSPRTNIPGFPGMFCNLQWIFHWIILSTIDLVGLNLAQLHSHCVGVTAEILSQTRLFSSPPLEKESNRNSYFERAISVVMIMNQTFPALQALSQTRLAVKLPADMQEKVIFFSPSDLKNSLNSNTWGQSHTVAQCSPMAQPNTPLFSLEESDSSETFAETLEIIFFSPPPSKYCSET